jgi:hypothetical protein
MKKAQPKKPLPKFDFVTLDSEKLAKVAGGLPIGGGGTCGTQSVCHVDGTDDCN